MGLLAKATAMREQWEREEAAKKLKALKPDFKSKVKAVVKKLHNPKLTKFTAAAFAVGLSLQTLQPRNFDYRQQKWQHLDWSVSAPAKIEQATYDFAQGLHQSKISNQERDNLARMLYGEAGRGADPFEVLHTVLNRAASPLFKGSLNEIITAKNQYLGYNPNHPVDRKLRAMVDFVVDEWEAHGCQAVDHCNHYYFVTGIAGICNKFEISAAGSQGRWVPAAQKHYEAPGHYCQTALDQAARFNQAYATTYNR